MSFTKRTDLDGNWAALTSSGGQGIAQLQDGGVALLHLGQSQPLSDSVDAVILWNEGLTEMPFLNAETGDVLYAKSKDGDAAAVSVISTGTAP